MDLRKLYPCPPPAKPGEINYPLVDRFTFAHFAIGLGYGYMEFSFWLALLLAVGWEIVENPLKYYASFMFPHGTCDTLQNVLGDVLAVLGGWAVYRFLF